MTQVLEYTSTALSEEVILAFDQLSGVHPGYRPAHAKGILLSGVFAPARDAMTLTRAPGIESGNGWILRFRWYSDRSGQQSEWAA